MADQIKLNEVVREMLMEAKDPDSFLHNTTDQLILFNIRNAYTHLITNGKMKGSVLSLTIDLIGGWKLPLPDDYIKYVRLSGMDDDGKIHELFLGDFINISGSYLLDQNNEMLFDDQGIPLKGRDYSYVDAYGNYGDLGTSCSDVATYGREYSLKSGVKTAHGQYKFDYKNRLIVIIDSPYTSFVLDYIADPTHFYDSGLSDIYVFKVWKDAIKSLAYSNLIARKRTVPLNEKQRAEVEHLKLTKAAILTNAPSLQEYKQWLNRSNGGAVNT